MPRPKETKVAQEPKAVPMPSSKTIEADESVRRFHAALGDTSKVQNVGRWALGGMLIVAGTSHLTWNRKAFLAQVPTWIPIDADAVVLASGVVEILLGLALLTLRTRRVPIGWIVAAFFVAIFPGNISQLMTHTNSFGLDTDAKRAGRLVFQPLLVVWALWSTGAWAAMKAGRSVPVAGLVH
jgi:uncharacterized membrane protein